MRGLAAKLGALIGAAAAAAAIGGCGSQSSTPPLTISFQGASSGPLQARSADMLRAAQLEIEAIRGRAAGRSIRLVDGPAPEAVATIDGLAGSSLKEGAQAVVTLAAPPRREIQPPRRSPQSAPRIWLAPPRATAESMADGYAESGIPGAKGTRADDPSSAGTPASRYMTAALSADQYPPAGADFFRKFEERYGRAPDRWAIYGYEAVGLVVDALTRLSEARQPVTSRSLAAALSAIRDRYSPLGHYDILPSGQSTLYVFQARGPGAEPGPASVFEALH